MTMTQTMTFAEFAKRYCETQDNTPEGLHRILAKQAMSSEPLGWILAEAQLMDSSWFGQCVILPVGPGWTLKEIPTTPFSPRGLASDTSVVIGWLPYEALDKR